MSRLKEAFLEWEAMPLLVCIGLCLLGMLLTGLVPPLREKTLPVSKPAEACHGKTGQTITMESGLEYVVEPDQEYPLGPCRLRLKTEAQPGRHGVWPDGTPAQAELLGPPEASRLVLAGSHSGRVNQGIGIWPTALIILGGSCFISLIYGVAMTKRKQILAEYPE